MEWESLPSLNDISDTSHLSCLSAGYWGWGGESGCCPEPSLWVPGRPRSGLEQFPGQPPSPLLSGLWMGSGHLGYFWATDGVIQAGAGGSGLPQLQPQARVHSNFLGVLPCGVTTPFSGSSPLAPSVCCLHRGCGSLSPHSSRSFSLCSFLLLCKDFQLHRAHFLSIICPSLH